MKKKPFPHQKGFTLIELVIVMAILLVLYAILSVNISQTPEHSSLTTQMTTLVSDIKNQQLKALAGQTSEGISSAYGIYFSPNSYTLFSGTSYSDASPSNITVNLNDNLTFDNVNLPQQSVVFSALTGEVTAYDSGQNTLSLSNSITNDRQTLTLNAWGAVISVN
ncbi:hypothetical protein A3J20_03175 [Candidatus Gottesmanbacteria bacterium RIFCSPLOWO2_02_FULL_42_29]|uniref:General secretion pathway GspH domain-containing protein n=2 Tax=Candidatus Gottesmaniibacteriota TaxID=1752720 RepID=A0A1F6B7P7_9BACT|nr:MAG: hypothetical protein UV09_C0003G0021 [Candidatus Gottesmanbacteria bacterium GW2011_GWA2_42_18]OGG10867.1 MAG: hypothetical protein A2781_02070 [Candidatus Gottesmanbacteria bacterium RIFCSPHIGHO2_01_FULL_42_27]OGG19198.1 MAG: hypothetical protein A3E72_00340 [Candidatus Gottesmanbacteria bacterium RIFCSPHIGHO2_12_FULL_43_26]OGG32960.1 MAG: hypothetical protein A2968_06860 [Candidatus Gottesmanbacteria bacterium RIFCSPLOWO2_01_FULL_42_22]OGG36969.1 MAG: hypothetical protein A3J20_03175 